MTFGDHWQRTTWLSVLLWLPSLVFRGVVAVRRSLYRIGVLGCYRSQLTVVVVGNLTVGGSGKTPVTVALVQGLLHRGFKPGVIMRGYHSSADATAKFVGSESRAADVGDEALLIARRTGVPVCVSPRRRKSMQLLERETDCDVVISDDGLQHYALARDFEIACVDSDRGFGNGQMLPAGPLREPPERLASVDQVLHKNSAGGDGFTLVGNRAVALNDESDVVNLDELKASSVHAVAGIADPESFFAQLESSGLSIVRHAFPDHHAFRASDFQFDAEGDILMTEKDAVKCHNLNLARARYLPVEAKFSGDLLEQLTDRIATIVERRTVEGFAQ